MASRSFSPSSPSQRTSRLPHAVASAEAIPAAKLAFNADLVAIAIALALAALIRLNVLPRIGW